jgi:hypothetical protein
MKRKHIILSLIIFFGIGNAAFADRTLGKTEILQIFQKLTDQPKTTWMAAGTIEAIHEEFVAAKTTDETEIQQAISKEIQTYQKNTNKIEVSTDLQIQKLAAIPFNIRYDLSNEYTMKSNVMLKYDGKRFFWEIDVDSRKDSVTLPTDLQGNDETDNFNLTYNQKRIFAWDNQKYTMYNPCVNTSIVDTTGSMPHSVTGPLTAGVIPWGYGFFTYENLSASKCSAIELSNDAQTQISITLTKSDGSTISFILDPKKDYAVLSCLTINSNSITTNKYSNYQFVRDSWMPMSIDIEKYDASTGKLIASEKWLYTSISSEIPETGDFDISYTDGTTIEYHSNLANKPLIYTYSSMVDTEQLLAEKLLFATAEGKIVQNCATAAIKHVASQLGKSVTDQQLAALVNSTDQTTSLAVIKNFLQGLGLYCQAVKTDIQTLKDLRGYQVILHIPGKKHFTVMGDIDSAFVWTIDLASNKFFYRTDLNYFNMDWTQGVALIISSRPVTLQGNIAVITDSQAANITGASGYSCTNLIQRPGTTYCFYLGFKCFGPYQIWYERYGCIEDESGSCIGGIFERKISSPCLVDIQSPSACNITGEWTYYYMQACS